MQKAETIEIFNTSLGYIRASYENDSLTSLAYLERPEPKLKRRILSASASELKAMLDEYLITGNESLLAGIEYELHVTDFQTRVLDELKRIPIGQTRTYGEIAKILHTSPRAVGNACRRNPLPIIIPCHRVLAKQGMGGYDGATSGRLLDIKQALLNLERKEFSRHRGGD